MRLAVLGQLGHPGRRASCTARIERARHHADLIVPVAAGAAG